VPGSFTLVFLLRRGDEGNSDRVVMAARSDFKKIFFVCVKGNVTIVSIARLRHLYIEKDKKILLYNEILC
jgi:hypothetical protein